MAKHPFNHHFLHNIKHPVTHIISIDDFIPETIKPLALFVHHVIIFKRATAHLVVVLFHPLLRSFNRTIKPWMSNFFIILHAHFLEHRGHLLAVAIEPHQVVLQTQEEVGTTWISLPRTTAA